jgi:hypothetical protein
MTLRSGAKSIRSVLCLLTGAVFGLSPGPVVAEPGAKAEGPAVPVGVQGTVGCRENPTVVDRLEITRPGVYENYLVEGHGAGGNRVKITADDVTLRHCEIRNASGNGVGIFGRNATIEGCKIHHLLASTFRRQHDAHGITGRWDNVTIRNCEIFYVSGDCIQFDPDRQSTGSVLIEDCTLWTGPLPADARGFHAEERPGENAFDSKTPAQGPRCRVTIRNCYLHGWNQPGQIDLLAALNLKENVDARVERCVFRDNQVGLRLRGPGPRGGAVVEVIDCAIYDSAVGVRMEDEVHDLKIRRLGFGPGVGRKYQRVGGVGPGYENTGEFLAPAFEQVLTNGFPPAAHR